MAFLEEMATFILPYSAGLSKATGLLFGYCPVKPWILGSAIAPELHNPKSRA
jgi:hypothetical protein